MHSQYRAAVQRVFDGDQNEAAQRAETFVGLFSPTPA